MFKHFRDVFAAIAILALPAAPAFAASSSVPGTLNYVEGQVTLASQPVTSRAVGSAQLEPNQVLQTARGRAELLLTPGVFLRIGDNSSVRLISPDLGNTRVELLKGRAIVEVAEIFKDNNLWVNVDGSSTRLEKEGLYSFDADARQVRVYDGKASVQVDDHTVDLKKGRELALAGTFKATHFDTKQLAAQDPLYAWSNLRSEYEAQASMQSARNIFVGGAPYWDGPGWYWNPYWSMYGFIPGDGIWYSPFGWPFYSPWVVYSAGWYGGFHRYGALGARHIGGNAALSYRGSGAAHLSGGFAGHGFAGNGFAGHGFAAHGFAGGMRSGMGGGRR